MGLRDKNLMAEEEPDKLQLQAIIDKMLERIRSTHNNWQTKTHDWKEAVETHEKYKEETDTKLGEKDTKLAQKDTELEEKDAKLAEKDTQLAEKDTQLEEKDKQLAETRNAAPVIDTSALNDLEAKLKEAEAALKAKTEACEALEKTEAALKAKAEECEALEKYKIEAEATFKEKAQSWEDSQNALIKKNGELEKFQEGIEAIVDAKGDTPFTGKSNEESISRITSLLDLESVPSDDLRECLESTKMNVNGQEEAPFVGMSSQAAANFVQELADFKSTMISLCEANTKEKTLELVQFMTEELSLHKRPALAETCGTTTVEETVAAIKNMTLMFNELMIFNNWNSVSKLQGLRTKLWTGLSFSAKLAVEEELATQKIAADEVAAENARALAVDPPSDNLIAKLEEKSLSTKGTAKECRARLLEHAGWFTAKRTLLSPPMTTPTLGSLSGALGSSSRPLPAGAPKPRSGNT